MNLYFSDWTTPKTISMLKEKGIPAEHLIKVFATEEDPSKIVGRQIATITEDESPFAHDYHYEGRGSWLCEEMEEYLSYQHLPQQANEKIRALFRFANRPDLEIAQRAMLVINEITKKPHYSHPLRLVDGLDEAKIRGRLNGLHLDIFIPVSLEKLGRIVDLNDKEKMTTIRESVQISRVSEGQNPAKESKL